MAIGAICCIPYRIGALRCSRHGSGTCWARAARPAATSLALLGPGTLPPRLKPSPFVERVSVAPGLAVPVPAVPPDV